ncbi:type III secretion system protein InvA [Burkholderia sp. ABCPW 14]|uniref:EscV/YscV/HrcV family type III secretion system export apparatus protein n=1 Tax=Burkholderia sp. ABCPW 14 TaxID=1637860 RepID=UPI000770BF17|nr:EscV/YscV/HrcV family type III secretion system export apparatus protein [Burkholderia sp. ABCPW 14]KVD78009.1 type III secretion system protein InvA [Burkholderia sp. ABCPW 14]
MHKNLLAKIQSRPELIVLLLMVLVIAMLIVPLPAYVLDFLIGFNITTALLVFMGSFYIVKILEFSTFPSILLITTLFRLALSISTSRLILLQAEGGKIITTFGQFVIGDNLVVGFVVFAIVTIVQFIVITKGSERVAEVAARFSLDAMPGKQMSIDADLRAGVIDNDGVKARRTALEQESQLYGAFDGAMKFIKGDAIAGIIVIFVNLIGGISVGVAQHGMSMSEALTTYTILTIGDGLVAQIPALLIAISAGFVVTRVGGSEKNLGQGIVGELFSNPFALAVTAVLAISIGMLPGFPLLVFGLIAAALGSIYVRKQWFDGRDKQPGERSGGLVSKVAGALSGGGGGVGDKSASGNDSDIDKLVPETVPLMLMVSERVKPVIEKEQVIATIRRRAFIDMGLRLPDIHLSYSQQLDETQVVVLINEIRAATFSIAFDRIRVIGSTLGLEALNLDVRMLPDGAGGDAWWVRPQDGSPLAKMDIHTRSATDDLYGQFLTLMLRNVNEFFGVQEAKRLLDDVEKKYPELLKETYRHASVQRVSEVLQRLLGERISVRNMKLILEALAQWAPKEKDAVMLVEHVRAALARYISNRFALNNRLNTVVLSAEIEEMVNKGVRQTSTGAYLNLEPAKAEELLDMLALELGRIGYSQRDVVLLTTMEIRRFVKRLVESRFPDLEVLSFGEVADGIAIDVLKTI